MPRKNANGAGSIYFDKTKKRYYAAITVGTDDAGRPRRRKVSGLTQAAVRRRLDDLRRAEAVGPGLPADLTVRRFLDHWADTVLPAGVQPTTATNYGNIIGSYIIPVLGDVRLDQLSPADVRTMLAKMRAKGLSPNTMRLARAVLRRALRTAEADGLVTRNVAALVDGVKQRRPSGRTLTPTDARTLLTGAQGHEYGALVAVLLSTGLRKGEALGLGWGDVDLDSTAATLTVRRSLKKDARGGLYVDEPKTSGSRRTIHLPATVVDVLRRHRVAQAEQRLAFGAGWGGQWTGLGLVFTSSVGSPLDPDRVNRQVQALTESCGLGRWTPHALRHSAASLLLAQGVPLKTISEMLGHASIRITADVYGHLLEPAKAEAATAMESALWG